MADRPIIFSAPMVRALLAGRKTQTRRIVKVPGIMGGRYPIYPPEEAIELEDGEFARGIFHYASTGALSGPYRLPAAAGDRLYVREAWSHTADGVFEISQARMVGRGGVIYRADPNERWPHARYWPSIHMPREFSRLTLIVEDVRVERLNDISEADAIREGVTLIEESLEDPVEAFRALWNSLHGPDAWAANPWIVAVSSRLVRENIDRIAA